MEVFVGEVIEAYIDESLDSEGKPNIADVNPLVYSMDGGYYKVGDFTAKAYSIGKEYEGSKKIFSDMVKDSRSDKK